MIACFKESKHQQFTQKAERRKKVPSMNRRRDRIQYFPPGLQKATEFQFNEFLFWVKHLERTSLSFMRDANKVARSFDNGHSANILRQIADLPAWVDQARNAQSLQCWKHNSYKRWGFMSCFFQKHLDGTLPMQPWKHVLDLALHLFGCAPFDLFEDKACQLVDKLRLTGLLFFHEFPIANSPFGLCFWRPAQVNQGKQSLLNAQRVPRAHTFFQCQRFAAQILVPGQWNIQHSNFEPKNQ